MTEHARHEQARPLVRQAACANSLGKIVGETFAQQGFASTELVTRWTEIVGAEIAAHAEPIKIQWPRRAHDGQAIRSPATLVLRGRGPGGDRNPAPRPASSCERVNRFFGWQRGRTHRAPPGAAAPRARQGRAAPDAAAAARIADGLPDIADDDLRAGAGAARRRGQADVTGRRTCRTAFGHTCRNLAIGRNGAPVPHSGCIIGH